MTFSHRDAISEVVETLGALVRHSGCFRSGSNDYYAPKPINPARYLTGPSGLQPNRPMLTWRRAGLIAGGWLDLSNTASRLKADGREIDIRGVDDPHIGRDDYGKVAGPFDPGADLALAVAHAPYRRVLDPMAADGAHLIMAGHTHGGHRRPRLRRAGDELRSRYSARPWPQ